MDCSEKSRLLQKEFLDRGSVFMDEGDSADEDDPELSCFCLVYSRRTASRIILHARVWVQRGQFWIEASAGMSPDDVYSLNFGITI